MTKEAYKTYNVVDETIGDDYNADAKKESAKCAANGAAFGALLKKKKSAPII